MKITIIALAVSAIGVADMANRWRNGNAYRELRAIKNPSPLTINILKQCKGLLTPMWWHWASIAMFIACITRLTIDSYRN